MKKLILFTLVLVAALGFITVKYFKSLTTSGVHAGNIMRTIPDSAVAVFEFSNDKGFYEIFTDNTLLGSLIGEKQLSQLDTVRKVLFSNPALQRFFDASNIFISLHPSAIGGPGLLLTAAAAKDFDVNTFDDLAKQKQTGMLITSFTIDEKKGFTVYFTALKKRFYLVNTDENIFSASFSKDLVVKAALYKNDKENDTFKPLPDQQNLNSLANLYINYEELTPLFDKLFRTKNHDLFKSFRLLPATAGLNLNYKTDALMFNGYTNIRRDKPASYLNLFATQAPVENNLKEIFPSTTSYSMSMAVSDPAKFLSDLITFHEKAGLKTERDTAFARVKKETGIDLRSELKQALSNEFAVVTTRYRERFAIITIKDGAKLRPAMVNISTMVNDDMGQFNYNKLPYFLLGDAFNSFRRPYFRIMDNYLVLANSVKELDSFADSYLNRKFINKTEQYSHFDNLTGERSNVTFFINFRNSRMILQNDLKENVWEAYKSNELSPENFYGASYQLTATDNNFYTNFCMLRNAADSTNLSSTVKNVP
ncbi:hypothetical protein [Mucilaginibacter pedocola]|uniref:DUF3352 domain-containing protein n=1 Tax=Mucilaginibacter pedocola TaxID=1792845 RepID=A0A1S9PGE5_9SPHI|nr:hypothetical protein [Mucilaginibacter pedocola]OOQ59618.1 hypothetical protein BC343_05490 [Mucilaginibacter pedocola]